MPDSPLNQASGLLGLAAAAGPQLIAVASHGDEHSELPTLWRLCATLVELDYAVTVLDATQPESDSNPGLQQLLDYRFGYGPVEAYATQWSVLAATYGLQRLCAQDSASAGQALQRIGHLFASNSVVILFAGTEQLAALLEGSAVQPLLCVSNEKNSLLTSYLTLKRLLIEARLQPVLLNVVGATHNRESAQAGSVCSNLRTCARNFLGYEVNAITIDTSMSELQQSTHMRRLAMHLLETALALQHGVYAGSTGDAQAQPGHWSWSH